MYDLKNKNVLVIGLGVSGRSACGLLLRRGARVFGVDSQDSPELAKQVEPLSERGVHVTLGGLVVPDVKLDLAVLSPGVPRECPLVRQLTDTSPNDVVVVAMSGDDTVASDALKAGACDFIAKPINSISAPALSSRRFTNCAVR